MVNHVLNAGRGKHRHVSAGRGDVDTRGGQRIDDGNRVAVVGDVYVTRCHQCVAAEGDAVHDSYVENPVVVAAGEDGTAIMEMDAVDVRDGLLEHDIAPVIKMQELLRPRGAKQADR